MAKRKSSYQILDELNEKHGLGNSGSSNNSGTGYSGGKESVLYALNRKHGILNYDDATKKMKESGASVSSWFKRYNSAISGFNDYDKKRNGGYTQDASGGFGSEIDSLIQDFDSIRSYAGRFGLPNAQQYLKQLQQIKQYIGDTNATMSKFSNEDDYNTAVRYGGYYQKYNGQTYSQLQDVLSKMEDGEEKDWLTQFAPSTITDRDYAVKSAQNNTELYYAEKYLDEYAKIVLDSSLRMSDQPQGYAARNIQQESDLLPEIKALNEKYGFRNKQEAEARIEELKAQNWEYQKTREYGFLDQNADYGELSSIVPDDKTAGVGIGIGTRWFGQGDPVYDYINNIDGAREVHPAQEGKTPYSIYDYMDEKEIADYNYLYNAQGKEAAQGYLDYLKYTLDQRRMEKLQENTAAYATDHPVISSALSVPMNLLSGAGVLDVAGQYAARKISGEYKPINYNRSGMVPTAVTTATRETVAKNIADATGTISLDTEKHPILSRILNGKSLGDVYQLGMSMADSAAIAGLAAVGIPGGTALLGGSAASQGVLDALEAGADDTQALTMGILNGVFEMLFEEVSLEKLLKGNTKGIVRSILEQGAVEGSEEFFTTLANTVADTLVMAEKSDYRSKIAEYMSQGLSENKATLRAIEDIAIGMGWDFVGGMLTGGIMGGVSKPIQNYSYASETGKLLYGSDPGALVSEALETDPENKLAEKMKGKLGSGESVSGYQLYKLAQQNETALRGQDTDAIQKAASVRLKDLGETGDVETISAALAKQASGESLSKGESQLIQESKYGNRVSQELNQENIRSGDYASDWAKNIGTKRIGLDVYNQSLEQASIGKSEPIDGTKNDSIVRNTLNTESKTAKNDSIRKAVTEDKPFELSDETGKTLLNLADGSTVETEITGIASTGKGKLMLNVSGQSEPVRASSISYASTADATLYNAINSMEISPEDAKRFVNLARSSGDTTGDFAVGIQQMYILGKSGVPISKAMNSRYGAKLSDTNKRFGYAIGRAVYNAQVQKAESEKKNVAASQRARAATGGTKINGVQYDGLTVSRGKDGSVAIDGVNLNAQQKAGIQAAEMLAGMGVNIHVFQSRTDANGKPIGEHGSYHLRDGSIHIDLNAGNLGQGVMAYTIAHEFTHFMEQQIPAKFQAFTDALFTELDVDVEAEIEDKAEKLLRQQPEQYKNASRDTLLEDARSEVVAEACETMLTDTDAAQRIGQSLKAKDATLFEKVKQWFRDLADKLRKAYKGPHPDSEIAQYAKKTIQQVDGLVQMWADMAVDAAENYQSKGERNSDIPHGVKYDLREYTEQQKRNWSASKRIEIFDNQQQLLKFIRNSIDNKTMDKKMYFGAIPSDLAARIKADAGVDVENYNLSLGSYEVRKILKDHGNETAEALRGQRAIVADDFAHIVDIVLNPLAISLSENTYMGKPAIVFTGEYNGRMNVVAVVSDKRLDLFVQTVYVNVKKGNLSTPIGDQAPINTPEASSGTVSNSNVSQPDEKIKQKNSDRDYDGFQLSKGQQDQQAALEKQNGKLREDVERLRELLKLQGKTTGGKLFKPESIKTAANFIMRETGRSLDADGKAEFAGILTKAYTALSDENVTYDDIIRECTNVAEWLDENGETKDALDEYAGGILSEMKGIPIRLDETQKAEARRLFGSLREFRSRIAGTYKLSPDGVPLDDVWNGLSIEHPMFFDGDASSAGLPGLLVEAIDRLRGSVNTDPYQHMPVDMMMRKVYEGFWKARKLTTVADRYQSKIDAINAKHDAAMQEMQDAHKAEIADLNRQWDEEAAAMEKSHKYDLQEQERLHKEHLRQVREEMNHDAEAELEKVIGQYRDQRKASVENRHRTQYREQIYKMADKFHKMATAPAKANTAHAPIQLVNAVAKFCEIFADSEERALEYAANRLDSRETELRLMNDLRGETKTRLKEADAINRQRERLYKKHHAVSAMKEQYSKIQNDPAFGMFYDNHVDGLLESLSEQLDGTDIYDMDTEQLKQVYSTMQAMMYTITNANRVISMEKDKTLIGVTKKLAGEIDANKIRHGAFVSGLRDYGMWQMSPDTFFNFICGFKKGNEGKAIQKMFVDGSDRMLAVQRDFYQMFRHLTEAEDKNVRNHITQMMKNPMKEMIDWGMNDAAGNPVKTTRDMMIQAYMLLNQKDSFDSIIYGGFALPNAKDYYSGKIDRAYGSAEEYQLLSASIENDWNELVRQIRERQDAIDSGGLDVKTVNQLQEEITSLQDQAIELAKGSEARLIEMRDAIEAKLTDVDFDAIETAKRWYKYAGQLMSDVHLQMYGYRPNLVDGYVPIHRDLATVKTDIREGEEDKAFNLENSGFTKDRVKSRAPILLTGFFQELQSQQIKISRYYGFAQVQKDFNRIWNMRVPGYGTTIKKKVSAKFGTGKRWLGVSGEQYVLNYIQSVAGVKGNDDILSSFYGNAASATLSANPRVAVSQLASIPTAAAVVGWKSMAKGFAKGVSTSVSTEKKNLLANDSVWFFQRYRGAGGITEISDLKAKGGIWGKIANSPVGKALFNWCQSMDVFATASMWAMAEDYVQQGGMKTTDDGYKLAVEQCYADIIRRSQPNYTVTERSDLLRDKRGGMKLLTMYKTQSNQNLNILINSIGEYRAAATAMRSVKNETTIADFKAAKNNLINGVTSVAVGGTLVFVLLRTMINFIMAKVDPYRDDETDELTMESAMGAITQEIFSSISGMFALGGQLYDIVNSVVSGDNYYGISDSAISSLAAVPENMVALIQRWKDPDKDVEWKHVEKVLSSSLALCGIPYKNLRSFYDAAGQWYRDLKGGTFWQYVTDATDKQYRARILKAWQSGDMEKINDTLAILAAKSEKDTDEDILKDVTHGFANNYLKDKVKDDEISPEDAADLLKYIGHDDPDGVVQKWVFQMTYPDIDSSKISDKLVSSYNQRGDINEKVFLDAYWFASSAQADKDKDGKSINGSKKAKIVKYIQSIPGLSFEQQKRLYILLDVGSLKDTPWE